LDHNGGLLARLVLLAHRLLHLNKSRIAPRLKEITTLATPDGTAKLIRAL